MSNTNNPINHTESHTKNITQALEKTKLIKPDIGAGYKIERRDSSGNTYTEQITNFDIVKLSTVYSHDATQVLLKIKPANESSFTELVDIKIFNEPRDFRKSVVTGETTIFNGGREALNELRKYVGMQDAPVFEATDKIGLHYKGYCSSIVTPDNIYHSNFPREQGYVHAQDDLVSVAQELDIPEEFDGDTVAEIQRLITDVRDNERFLAVLGWFYSSTLTPMIRGEVDEVAGMSILGDTGAGKSTTMKILSKMFGVTELRSPTSSEYVLIRELASSSSVPLVYDEVKRSEMTKYEADTFATLLRSATKGRTEARGNYGASDNTYSLKAPVAIIGEMDFGGNAMSRRMVKTTFRHPNHLANQKTENLKKLQDTDLSHHAGAVHAIACAYPNESWFGPAWDEAKINISEFQDEFGYNIAGLEETALVQMELGRLLFEDLADHMEVSESEIPDKSEWWDSFDYVASNLGAKERTSHLDELLELSCQLVRSGEITEPHEFRVMGSYNTDDLELRVKIDDLVHAASRYLHQHNLSSNYDLLSADDYKGRLKELEDVNSSYVIKKGRDGEINRCWFLDLEELDAQIEDFDAADFNPDTETGSAGDDE